MTESELNNIKALARIIVEGIVSTIQKQRDERENLRQNTKPDLLSPCVGAVPSSDLVSR